MEKNCVFCRIVHKEIPAYKIYEDGLFFGFLDINPRVIGHSLLIPKNHYQWVYEVPEFKQFWAAALTVTRAMQKALSPTFITYVTHGLEVPHAHIHILPRKHEREFVPNPISIPKEKMEKIAQLLEKSLHVLTQ